MPAAKAEKPALPRKDALAPVNSRLCLSGRSVPARPAATALTLQTRHDWSEARIEDDVDAVAGEMKTRFTELTGLSMAASGYDRVHRWRYASTVVPAGQSFLYDAAMGLSAIGDWCTGSKVEDAFLSGHKLGAHLRG